MICDHMQVDRSLLLHGCREEEDAPGIHALILGISSYPYPADLDQRQRMFSDIPGASVGAAKFAVWLRDTYRHPQGLVVRSLRVVLEPVHQDLKNLPVEQWGSVPDSAGMTRYLKAWRDECAKSADNVGILYAAGHGAAITPTAAHIFLPDVNVSGDQFGSSLNMAVVQEAMEYCPARANVYVADACASREKTLRVPSGKGAGLDIDPDAGHLRRRSLSIASARFGTEAWTTDKGDSTVFSEVFLQLIDRAGEWLPGPDFFAVTADRIEEDFPAELCRMLGPERADRQLPHFAGAHEASGLHRPDPAPKFEITFRAPTESERMHLDVHRFGTGEIVASADIEIGQECRKNLPAGPYYYTTTLFDGRSTPPENLIVSRDRAVTLAQVGEVNYG